MPFFAYVTQWSEGTVVAHTDDSAFAIGYDALNGNIVYVKEEELNKMVSYHKLAEFDDERYVKMFDTALYPRRK